MKNNENKKRFSEMTIEEKSKAIKEFLMGLGDLRQYEYQSDEDPVEYGKRVERLSGGEQ